MIPQLLAILPDLAASLLATVDHVPVGVWSGVGTYLGAKGAVRMLAQRLTAHEATTIPPAHQGIDLAANQEPHV